MKAVVYDFAPSRAGEHARAFLGDWRGKLVTDDYSGYKKTFQDGVTEIGCMAHGRRAAAVMSLIQSAKLNSIDPHAYLKDVLTRLPTHPNRRIDELLPHNWRPANA